MDGINPSDVAKKYNSITDIWQKKDKWHWLTYQAISNFISRTRKKLDPAPQTVLNAGSAGNNYSIPPYLTTHIDLAEKKIASCTKKVIGSIESIPIDKAAFDLIVCVGSVLNYCDPIKAISEFSRVAAVKSNLIIEFENSKTLELLGTRNYNRKAVFANTFYNKQKEKIWYYSESFIKEILRENGYAIVKIKRFHILSPLIYRITKNENFSSIFKKIDFIMRMIPLVRKNSSNIILLAKKCC